ncbi:MAG: DUF2752 domain-containing protein, partial [Micromonosporaceae bacterium]
MVQVTDSSSTTQPGVPWTTQPGVGHRTAEPGDPAVTSGTAPPPVPMATPPRKGGFTGLMQRLWTQPAWFPPLAVLTCFAGFSAFMLSSDPTDGRPDAFGGCAVKMLTGFDCPGCGGTRAFWYLIHGNLPEAARHHLLAVFAAPFLIYMYVAWAGRRAFGWRIRQLWIPPKLIAWFAISWA